MIQTRREKRTRVTSVNLFSGHLSLRLIVGDGPRSNRSRGGCTHEAQVSFSDDRVLRLEGGDRVKNLFGRREELVLHLGNWIRWELGKS